MTTTELCSMALAHLGLDMLSNFDTDRTKPSEYCRLWYPSARDTVLETHNWGFARKHQTLALVSDVTVSGWTYVYGFPTDCLRARLIYNANGDQKLKFEVRQTSSGTVIVSDQQEAELIYTARITDLELYPTAVLLAMTYKLASLLAVPLKGELALRDAFHNVYLHTVGLAQADDAREGTVNFDDTSDILDSRS